MIDLYRSENLLVRCLPASDQSRWVVTFDNYGIGHGFDRQGFGETFFQTAGISAIHVMGVREDWYQYSDIFDAMAAVRQAVAGAARVMTYGSSMGGYAALRFAEAAGANAALAMSPQYSIDPSTVPFEMRWTQDAGRIQWLPEIAKPLSLSFAPIVVYDTRIEDAQHAALISADTEIVEIKLPYTGHPSTTALGEVGLLRPLVLQALSGELDVPAFRKSALKARRQSPKHLAQLASAQPEHRLRCALDIAQKAVELAPYNGFGLLALARLQSRMGLHDQAIEHIRPMAKNVARDIHYFVHLADMLAAAGRYPEALDVAEQVVTQLPDHIHLRAWKAHFHWLNGEVDQAIGQTRDVISLDPLNAHYSTSLEAYEAAQRSETPIPSRPAEPTPPHPWLRRLVRSARRLAGYRP